MPRARATRSRPGSGASALLAARILYIVGAFLIVGRIVVTLAGQDRLAALIALTLPNVVLIPMLLVAAYQVPYRRRVAFATLIYTTLVGIWGISMRVGAGVLLLVWGATIAAYVVTRSVSVKDTWTQAIEEEPQLAVRARRWTLGTAAAGLAVCVALFFTGGAAWTDKGPMTPEEVVQELAEKFRLAWNKQDMKAIASFFREHVREKIEAHTPTFVSSRGYKEWPSIKHAERPDFVDDGVTVYCSLENAKLITKWKRFDGRWWLVVMDFD